MLLPPLAIQVLHTSVTTWLSGGAQKLERAAFLKDIKALIEVVPNIPSKLQFEGAGLVDGLINHMKDCGCFNETLRPCCKGVREKQIAWARHGLVAYPSTCR
ncbi:unnamed protein product [Polarella glacialis]|uniref:Uncharacterized protein n=1 Tax=Polarella glacialis TaxID=89957 RepID=A0A813JVM9_POLGL|nr:unnamed protein product [Polarella glacialis]